MRKISTAAPEPSQTATSGAPSLLRLPTAMQLGELFRGSDVTVVLLLRRCQTIESAFG